MNLQIGTYETLVVTKRLSSGYILRKNETEGVLHFSQVVVEIELGHKVKVFLYVDSRRRLNASMKELILPPRGAAFIEVVGVNEKVGVFLDIGLNKDLLFSIDDLPVLKKHWPVEGDELLVTMKAKSDQLVARPVSRFQVASLLQPNVQLKEGEMVTAWNIHFGEEGNVLATKNGHTVFVYYHHMRKSLRLGEMTTVRITHDRGNYHYAGTMIENKENMMDKDASLIMEILSSKGGFVSYNDKTDPTVIRDVFNMSKSAFKRAIGRLYKQQMISISEKGITLIHPLNKQGK